MAVINLGEILVVNTTGVAILLVLMLLRVENKATKHTGDFLFEAMSGLTLGALVLETLSFLLDGQPGRWIHLLQYAANGYLFLASCAVGLLWVLFVNTQIYHSRNQLRKRLPLLLPPFLLIVLMILCDFFGTGLIFSITEENVYFRGRMGFMPYLVLFYYYGSSFVLAIRAVRHNNHVHFFPIYYFVIPGVVGTIVQGLFYGLAAGWFSVCLALCFIRMQLQNRSTFVDDLSGLYNRKYYLYYLHKLQNNRRNKTICGIMLDVNHFKRINDQFGHTMGDDAIRNVGQILSEAASENSIVFRLAGDEFIILTAGAQEEQMAALQERINQALEQFNAASGKPYQLSMAMGCVTCDPVGLNSDRFLHEMDTKMYQAKAAYYSQAGKSRRQADHITKEASE